LTVRITSSSFVVLIAAVVVGSPTEAPAQELKPFSNVQSVGPSKVPAYDKIVLKGGKEIQARVQAENPMFYVLERFGEYRAVGRDKVASIERSSEAKREDGHQDQILCKNGHVLTGKILSERADGMYEVKQPNQAVSQAVWKSEIVVIFKKGKQVFPASS
jgi:hypothetical protein